ncbi:MAG: hypothetical protein CM1200mP18_21600 [Gammaproteobacteria bacterium]|nr:MAG: hypothetical protein CM1200mP18_21600 [Gammaproteobacteria bacterium]
MAGGASANRWSDLKVHVTSVSEQWAGIAVAGPCSRTLLRPVSRIRARVSNDNFPFMGVIETVLKDKIPFRIARISFSGELAYEVIPLRTMGPQQWICCGVCPNRRGCLYGLEALGAMRIEKGHVTGAELDGRVTIEDAGLGRMASSKKSYIGSALRKRPELVREDRPRLVGIFPINRHETFNAGAILCAANEFKVLAMAGFQALPIHLSLATGLASAFLPGVLRHGRVDQ